MSQKKQDESFVFVIVRVFGIGPAALPALALGFTTISKVTSLRSFTPAASGIIVTHSDKFTGLSP
jgi:hypothetical protein